MRWTSVDIINKFRWMELSCYLDEDYFCRKVYWTFLDWNNVMQFVVNENSI
jgi:hypothetical protein